MPPKSATAGSGSTLTSPTVDPIPVDQDQPEDVGEDENASDPERGEQESAALAQQQAVMLGLGELDLPRTVVTKLAKAELGDSAKFQQDVISGLIRSATVFITYFTAAAHDQTLNTTRKTIMPQDVIDAVKACGFEGVVGREEGGGLAEVLERELAAFRAIHSAPAKRPAANVESGPIAGLSKKSKTASTGVGRGNGRKSTGSAGGTVAKGKGKAVNGTKGIKGSNQARALTEDKQDTGTVDGAEERTDRSGSIGVEDDDEETERARRAVGADEDDDGDGMDVDDATGVEEAGGSEAEADGAESKNGGLSEDDVGEGGEEGT